ncbi:MAG: 3-oxoadipate enol-lactonase [Mesorhizobium sp.]|uniref:3-oxoadipate enol-lactonase n=1 Tax=Mesorhizobium sp. TaxID=1871066 RepID=UPI000FE88DAD|nr:3-oxoadipate enol-lactonase [Mesorhizobium sp.]RWL17946.1 MAG: 3-oxoadipate enol-lactonase [Mesorhizobium sp.]
MEFCSTGQLTLHFDYQKPCGNMVLAFINSLGTDFRIWDAVTTRFRAAGFGVLRYDKRGHGLSGLGAVPQSIDDHVSDLAGLLDYIGAEEVIAVGLSIGGLIAQSLYVRRPKAVRALILCDTAHRIGTTRSWNARIDAVNAGGIAAIADDILEKWFTPSFHGKRAEELDGYRAMLTRQSPDGYAASCAALRDADHTELVTRIAVPSLCLVGDQDYSTPPDLVKSMAELIPGARFEIIKDAGHIPCVEQPDDVFARIAAFLETNALGKDRYG